MGDDSASPLASVVRRDSRCELLVKSQRVTTPRPGRLRKNRSTVELFGKQECHEIVWNLFGTGANGRGRGHRSRHTVGTYKAP